MLCMNNINSEQLELISLILVLIADILAIAAALKTKKEKQCEQEKDIKEMEHTLKCCQEKLQCLRGER